MYDPDEECKAMMERLGTICKKKNITLRTLAKRANVSASTISCLLNGKTKPHLYTLLQLCNVLEISICELFSDGDVMEKKMDTAMCKTEDMGQDFSKNDFLGLSNDEKELLCHYQSLSDQKKKMLRICIDVLLQYSE